MVKYVTGLIPRSTSHEAPLGRARPRGPSVARGLEGLANLVIQLLTSFTITKYNCAPYAVNPSS